MKISVVIPAYNAASSIKATIESCLQQSYTPYEVIVVDDASTDDTVSITEAYKQVKLLQQPTNQGPSAARNRGWNEAGGDYIAFLDSDDTWHPKKLEIVLDVCLSNNKIEYLGHSYSIGSFQTITNTIEPVSKSYASILLKNPYQPSCLIVKRSVSERFNKTYRYCEDHELSLRVADIRTCHFLDMPLTKLGRPQLSKGGASGNKWKMRRGELRIYSSIGQHNPLYILAIPFLWIFSLLKMAYKAVS